MLRARERQMRPEMTINSLSKAFPAFLKMNQRASILRIAIVDTGASLQIAFAESYLPL